MEIYVAFLVALNYLTEVVRSERTIHIGAVMPADMKHQFSIGRVDVAAQIAIEKVNHTDFNLSISYRDSQCNEAVGMNEAINFYIHGDTSVLFGPVCDYAAAPVARQLRFWNLPMVSIGAMAQDFRDRRHTVYPMLTRAGPANFMTLSHFLSSTLKHFHWSRMKLLYEKYSDFDNIVPVFCHLVSDTLVQTLPKQGIRLDYKRLDTDGVAHNMSQKAKEVLLSEVSMSFSGRCIFF